MAPFPRNNAMSHTPPYGIGDASYQAAGGIAGLRRLVADFYRLMDERPEAAALRALHPADLSAPRDKLACFLSGWLGGTRLFAEKYGSISIPAFHSQWPIDQALAESWLSCMAGAVALQGYAPAFADYLLIQLRVPAERSVQASQNRHRKET